ncbi:MAG: ABC transporter permease, partial [Gemmatimonadales bacterium]
MPDWTEFLRRRLELPKMKGHRDERMIREIADHLEDLYRDALAGGATEAEAEAVVHEWLGDPERAAAELKTAEPARVRALLSRWTEGREDEFRRKGGFWTSLADRARDLRLGLRSLARRPMFTGVVVLVLALGIGATTAIFTLLDAIILSPLPFDDADRLVNLNHTAPGIGVQNAGQCAAWHFTYEDEARVFEDVGMFGGASATILGQGEPEVVPAMGATSGVFRALRVSPLVGRIFLPEDEEPESPNVVLLGYGYWQARFGGDPNVVGQTIEANSENFEIVGVLPPSIRSLGADPSLIFPYRFDRSTLFVGNIGFGSVARLKDGVSLEQAHADGARILPLALEKFPGGPVADLNERADYAPIIQPLKTTLVGDVASLLWIIMAGVGVVLLIACANVANLFLVRADEKHTEMAVRSAMGASRRRVGWEYLKESLLLGLMGGAAGLGLAYVGLKFLVVASPDNLPRMDEVSLNPDVLVFTLVVSLGAGLFFGVFPALRHGRGGLVNALKQGGRSGTSGKGRNRVRNVLAVSQVALALVLLVASGLMLRSVISLRNVDPGFHSPETVLTFRLYLQRNDIPDPDEVATTYEAIARRLEQIPGVTSVALGTALPMAGGNNVNPVYIEGLEYTGESPASIRRHKWIGGNF